jgi:uncharacterized sulfatase
VPFAVRYPKGFPGARIVNDPISFSDLAPTILEITGTDSEGMLPISGKSFLNILKSNNSGYVDAGRKYVFAGRERHSCSRYMNMGYPQRAIRSDEYLLIRNMKPDRWPAGAPRRIKPGTENELLPMYGIDENGVHHSDWAFTDIDAAPSKSFIIENMNEDSIKPYFAWAHAKRAEYEFFNIKNDPFCLENLSGLADHAAIEYEMRDALLKELEKSKDPRVTGPDEGVFDTYIRYSPMREFPKP